MARHSDEDGVGRAGEPSGQRVADQARTFAAQAGQRTAEAAGQATQQVSTMMADQKRRAADRLQALAQALREAADRLGGDEFGRRVEQYADRAADRMDSMSSYVREADLQRLVRDTGQFARRRPEVFIGGAFLAGLLAARFLKASSTGMRRPGTRMGGW